MIKNTENNRFKVIIERDGDGFFVASVPSLPGCHTQAKTLPELMHRVKDAIRLCVEVMQTNRSYRAKVRRFAYEPTFVGMEMVTV